MAVEIMENNLTFKVGRVFLLSHINENPYSLGVQLSGFTSSTGGFLVKACSLLFGQVQVQFGLGFGPFAFGLVRGHRFLHRTALLQQDESHPTEQDNQYPNPA